MGDFGTESQTERILYIFNNTIMSSKQFPDSVHFDANLYCLLPETTIKSKHYTDKTNLLSVEMLPV